MKKTKRVGKLVLHRDTLRHVGGGTDYRIPPSDTGPIWSSPDYGYCGSFDGACTYTCPELTACW